MEAIRLRTNINCIPQVLYISQILNRPFVVLLHLVSLKLLDVRVHMCLEELVLQLQLDK